MIKMVNFCPGLTGVLEPLSWLIFMHGIILDLKEAMDIQSTYFTHERTEARCDLDTEDHMVN